MYARLLQARSGRFVCDWSHKGFHRLEVRVPRIRRPV